MARSLILFSLIISVVQASGRTRDLAKEYEKAQFKLGEKRFTAYVADTDTRRSEGLMFVKSLPADTGMLFVFDEERVLGFWMKNTLIPLSIGFFDSRGNLIDIQEMKIAKSLLAVQVPSYQSRAPALFALEMESGWFKKNNVTKGTRLKLVSGTSSKLLQKKLPGAKPL